MFVITILKRSALYLAVCLTFTSGAYAQSSKPDLLVSSVGTDSIKRYDGETGTYEGGFHSTWIGGT